MENSFNMFNSATGNNLYSGKISKYKGEMLEGGISFYVRPLGVKDCCAMEDLSVCIYDNLKEGQECFIHKHDRNYYRDILSDEEAKVNYLGVFVGRHLVAMSFVRMIDNEKELQEELPNHKMNFFSQERKSEFGDVKIAAFGSDSVHPKYRGNQLNTVMVECRMNVSKQMGATDWVSIIDRKNVWNMSPYFSKGFSMFAAGVDPIDSGSIALLHRPVMERVTLGREFEKIHYENMNTIDKILYMNKVGVGYNKKTQEILFAPTDYYSNLRKQPNNMKEMTMKGKRYASRV